MNTSQINIPLAEVSIYSKRVLAQFQMDLYEIDDFESMNIDQSIDPEYFTDILKLFEGRLEEACKNLQAYPILQNISYLKKTHKYFLKKRILEIEHTIEHAFPHSEIKAYIQAFFQRVKICLLQHITLEEGTLFPYLILLH